MLRLYYVANDRVLVLDLGNGTWVDPSTAQPRRPMATGGKTTLPTDAEVSREGYELWGWYITAEGTYTEGTTSIQEADRIAALTDGFWGPGRPGHGTVFVMPDLAERRSAAHAGRHRLRLHAACGMARR